MKRLIVESWLECLPQPRGTVHAVVHGMVYNALGVHVLTSTHRPPIHMPAGQNAPCLQYRGDNPNPAVQRSPADTSRHHQTAVQTPVKPCHMSHRLSNSGLRGGASSGLVVEMSTTDGTATLLSNIKTVRHRRDNCCYRVSHAMLHAIRR